MVHSGRDSDEVRFQHQSNQPVFGIWIRIRIVSGFYQVSASGSGPGLDPDLIRSVDPYQDPYPDSDQINKDPKHCNQLTTIIFEISSREGAATLTARHRDRMAGITLLVEFVTRITLKTIVFF
jgi:hypothetical protein